MGLTKAQRGLLDKVLKVAADLAASRPLATSSELWLKVELAEWLLGNDYKLLEPAMSRQVVYEALCSDLEYLT